MEGGRDVFFAAAARASPPPPPPLPPLFHGSTAATLSGGAQMLSFSNGAAGLGLCSGASKMQGVLSRVRGPFTPTQWMELEHQALIYKHFAANAPVPSSLLLPIKRSLNPWGSLGSSSLGWAPFRSGTGDAEPGRCRRTDGKKWRCSRDAVGDQRYCERHIKRGSNRSRKHVEGRKATPTIADPAMVVSGGSLLHSHAVAWQQQAKSSAPNVTDPYSLGSNRNLLDKQNIGNQFSVSTSMDSFDFSASHSSPNHGKVALSPAEMQHEHDHSSPNHGKLAFSPAEMQHEHDQLYLVHGEGSSVEHVNMSQDGQLLVSRETIDDGPLGEVFKGKSCPSASADILTDQWTSTCDLHSPTGILQMSSSNTVPVENHTSNSYLTARMVNSQTVPTLH